MSEVRDNRHHISYWVGVWGAVMFALIISSLSFDFWGRWILWATAFSLLITLIIPEIASRYIATLARRIAIYVGSIVLFVAAFIINYNLPAPFTITSDISPNTYAIGAGMGGVHFLPEWTDLRVNLENPSDHDYEYAEFTISASMEIAGIGQISSVPGVEFVGQPHAGEFRQKDNEGHITTAIPAYLPTHRTVIRLSPFPKRTTLELILALAEQNPIVNGHAPQRLYVDRERPCWITRNWIILSMEKKTNI